jgi:GNAT superfamily N-acetyltransferase
MTHRDLKIGMRRERADDAPFIMQTWQRSYYKGSDFARLIHRTVYDMYNRETIEQILCRHGTHVTIGHDPESDDTIYGYIVLEEDTADMPIVHYLFVKEAWRQLGIATKLITATVPDPMRCYFTHHTKDRFDRTTGEARWRGAETLLRKWPAAHDEPDPGDSSGRRRIYRPGPVYNPYMK